MYDEPPIEPLQAPIPNEPPYWFEEALKITPKSHHLQVMDCNIHYLRWGPEVSDLNGILFIHGASAHAHWWDFIAPLLLDNFQVSALDMSGMGDSERREDYSAEVYGNEILQVADDSGFFEDNKQPIIYSLIYFYPKFQQVHLNSNLSY